MSDDDKKDLTAEPNGVLQQEPETLDTIVMRAHEIYGPAMTEAHNGDPYKISLAIGILSQAMTLGPGSYTGPEEAKEKPFKTIPGGKK